MGNCTPKVTTKTSTSSKSIQNHHPYQYSESNSPQKGEILCLKLIYDDLVSRDQNRDLTSSHFELFFHMNPLWGKSLYKKFVAKNGSNITEKSFTKAVLDCTKANPSEKLHILFEIYDFDDSDGISFNELIALFLTFELEEFNEILSKDEFLDSMSIDEMTYYLMSSKKINSEILNEKEKCNKTLYPYLPIKKHPSNLTNDSYFQTLQLNDELKNRPNFGNTEKKSEKTENSTEETEKDFGKIKILQQEFRKNVDKRKFKIDILNKYAEFIFKSLSLNKEKHEISFVMFQEMVLDNPKIYKNFFLGFHDYLWLQDRGAPKYKRIKPTVEDTCIQEFNGEKKEIYLVNIRNSLLIFESEKMNEPLEIKNLEGLFIVPIEYDSYQEYGFIVKHQDEFYPEKTYEFDSKQKLEKWMLALYEYEEKNVFKKYQIGDRIGHGSFANVFKCINKETQEEMAMKIIDKETKTNEEIESVKAESEIMANCAMENVVKAYERFENKNHIYLITEMIHGCTLYQYVRQKEGKVLTEAEARTIIKPLLQTVKKLHGLGIIHRDFKMENIMISHEDGRPIPKIIDFGLAVYKIDLENENTRHKFVGTPCFAAPEMFEHEEYDETIDVFSLGIILHFMITGTLPFHTIYEDEIRDLTLACQIDYEAKKWKKISSEAKELLSRMICRKGKRVSASKALEFNWFIQNPE